MPRRAASAATALARRGAPAARVEARTVPHNSASVPESRKILQDARCACGPCDLPPAVCRRLLAANSRLSTCAPRLAVGWARPLGSQRALRAASLQTRPSVCTPSQAPHACDPARKSADAARIPNDTPCVATTPPTRCARAQTACLHAPQRHARRAPVGPLSTPPGCGRRAATAPDPTRKGPARIRAGPRSSAGCSMSPQGAAAHPGPTRALRSYSSRSNTSWKSKLYEMPSASTL